MTEGHRTEYVRGLLDASDLLPDPIAQLQLWLEDATSAGVTEPMAMTVSTVSTSGRPSSRVVLLRGLDDGLIFYTNYLSRKGQEISHQPMACINFWWGDLERQVRVEGRIVKVAEEESDAYFASRPFESQLASTASPQSTKVDSRETLDSLVDELRFIHKTGVNRPDHWGGYRLIPDYFEFWQGRKARLHDRLIYEPGEGGWQISRLAP